MFTVIWFAPHGRSHHPQDWEEQKTAFETIEAAIAFAETVQNSEYHTIIQIPCGDSILEINVNAIRQQHVKVLGKVAQ